MKVMLKLFLLTVLLNLIRYFVAGPIEQFTILPRLFGAMAASPSYFNNAFTQTDFITSFFYNFVMWAVAVTVFHFMHSQFSGGTIVRSLKVFAIMYIFFASVSAIYMNHYSHPRDFYLYNMLDGMIVYGLVGLANGLIYPRLVGRRTDGNEIIQARSTD